MVNNDTTPPLDPTLPTQPLLHRTQPDNTTQLLTHLPHNSTNPQGPLPETSPEGHNDDVFYETEQEQGTDIEGMSDGELELPRSSHISGNKELEQGPPEDKTTSKRTRTANPDNTSLNE